MRSKEASHLVTDVRTFNGALLDLLADADFTLGQIGAMAGTKEHCSLHVFLVSYTTILSFIYIHKSSNNVSMTVNFY